MIIRPIILSLIAGSLSFCASEPVQLHYYLLSADTQQGVSVRTSNQQTAVVVDSIVLADYLQQSGIVLQTSETQIQISKRHLWAETLETALPKLLFKELQNHSTKFDFYLRYADFVPRSDYRLLVQIDSFQATDNGEVICSGRYQLVPQAEEEELISVDFTFNRDLHADGYDHAIDQLRLLVGDIAENILSNATALVEK